jgi:DNA helicase-2/ATP-dependent DNA helicase PcrA
MSINKEQLHAIDSNSDRILCLAGAGTGKSTTLLQRISRLVDDGVAASSILALTFTNAAAAEMRERYASSHVGQVVPEFRTFHSFCYSLICKDPAIRSALGYDKIPNIASDSQEKEIIKKAKLQCKISLTEEQLLYRNNLTKKERFQAELFDKAVTRLLKQDNLMTFDELNSQMAELFHSDHMSTHSYKSQYTYIMCDEFQDTDKFQMKFLSSFYNSKFFFVGDTLQNIYSFRGTDNTFIKVLSTSSDWEKIKLFTNYRSTKQICDFANRFSAKYADDSYRIEMKGTRDGDNVSTTLTNPPSNYNSINSEDIDDIISNLNSLSGTSAILCRSNREVSAVCNYLNDKGIKYSTNRESGIHYIIKCAISDEYMISWLATQLTSNKFGEYIKLSAQFIKPNLRWFLNTYGTNQKIAKIVKKVDKIKEIATNPNNVADKIKDIQDTWHIDDIEIPKEDLFGTEFLNYINDQINNVQASELYVGTIHSVKGLEYDNVFVLNVNSFNFRLDTEEMQNLYYVAITRAKNRLFIYKIAPWNS